MRFAIYIARRYLRSRRRSRFLSRVSVTAVVGVVLGVMVLDLTLAIMNGFHAEMRHTFVENMPMITVVTSAAAGFSDLGAVIDTIGTDPEVTGVSPYIRQEVIVTSKRSFQAPRNKAAITWGIDPDLVDSVQPVSTHMSPGERVLERLQVPGDLPGVVLGSDLAMSLYAGVGDTVVVTAPSGDQIDLENLEAKSEYFRVAGFLDSGMYEFDSRFAYIHIDDARRFFAYGPQGASGIGVRIGDLMRARLVGERIEQRLGYGFYATDWMALNENLFRWIRLEKVVMFLLLGLVVLVAAFNIIGILTMMVGERSREIGILLAMGARSWQIMGIFILNGLWLGLIGAVGGSFLGWLGAFLLQRYGLRLPSDVYFIDHIPVIAQPGDFLAVAGVTLLITILSTLAPSYEATKLEPMEIIRYT